MSRLEAMRRVHLVAQGEPESISLQNLDPTTREFVSFKTVSESFYPFFRKTADGRALPPDVRFEAQFGELTITDEDAKQAVAILYGATRYRVVRGDQASPGMFTPSGPDRFYRFHLAALEEAP